MPFIFDEDIDELDDDQKRKQISFEEEYERFVRSQNKPMQVVHTVRRVGRKNYFEKLHRKPSALPMHYVRFTVIDYDQYNRFQVYRMMKNALRSKKFPTRCHIGKLALMEILRSEMEGRIINYLDDSNMKKKILCIVGESGVGKTLVSLHLQNFCGANVICSYTTRPPRNTEVEGREHHFVDIVPPPEELLAFTIFGHHKYYATRAQVHGPCTVYVIDENGLIDLKERWKDEYEIYSVYITRKKMLRRRRGVDDLRMRRDNLRKTLDLSFYNYVIENNSTKKCLFDSIETIYNEIKEK